MFHRIRIDIRDGKDFVKLLEVTQEIVDFVDEWNFNFQSADSAVEMNYYKESWLLMNKYR